MDPEKEKQIQIEEERSHQDAGLSDDGHGPVNDKMTLQAFLAIVAIATQFISYINTLLMPSTILSYIVADLDDPNPNYAWITIAWNVCASVLVTAGGRLSDIFGRRWFLIIATIIALCGAVVGATGKSVNQMIASGVLFGIGGGIQEMCYAAIQEIVPMKHRVLTIGCFEFFSGCIALMSPLIAYAILGSYGWRPVYWYMFAFEGFSLIMIVCFYRPPNFHSKHRADGKTRLQLVREMDFVGFGLFTLGCILFLIGVNWGGRRYEWSSAPVVATIVIGAVLLVICGFYEAYATPLYPLFPPRLFKNVRGFTMLLVVCFVGGMLYYSMNVLWPRESGLLFVPTGDYIIAGVYANMVSFGTITAGFIVMVFCHRVGHERWQQVGFMVVQTALIGSLASIGVNDRAQAIATIIILAATITPPQLLSFAMISIGIDNQVDIGLANGLASTFRLMGGAVATAIYSAILTNRFAARLPDTMAPVIRQFGIPKSIAPDLIGAAAVNTPEAYAEVPGISEKVIAASAQAVKYAYVDAFKLVYLVALAFGGLAILAASFTKTIPKSAKTSERAIHLENESGGARVAEAKIV